MRVKTDEQGSQQAMLSWSRTLGAFPGQTSPGPLLLACRKPLANE